MSHFEDINFFKSLAKFFRLLAATKNVFVRCWLVQNSLSNGKSEHFKRY